MAQLLQTTQAVQDAPKDRADMAEICQEAQKINEVAKAIFYAINPRPSCWAPWEKQPERVRQRYRDAAIVATTQHHERGASMS